MKAVKRKVDALERQAQEDQQEAQKSCSSGELQVGVSADSMRSKTLRLTGKLEGVKNQVQALDPESIIDISEISRENFITVKGLWKLLALLKQKNQEAQTKCSTLESELESVKQKAQDERSTFESELESFKQKAQDERSTFESELESFKQKMHSKCSTLESELESVKQNVQDERSTLESELESVRQEAQTKCSTLESEFESVRQEAQTKCSTLESELDSVRQEAQTKCSTLESKLESVKQEAQDERSTLESELESTKCSTLELELESVRQEAQTKDSIKEAAAAPAAVTPPPTAQSASALSRSLKNVRQRNSFTACLSTDLRTPQIWDVQLLPGGRLLLVDWSKDCVNLFNTQGQHLHTLECRSAPYCLAVLDSSSIRHAVAVTLPDSSAIDLLEVTGDDIKVKRTLQTSRGYDAVAASKNNTLAVGYFSGPNIDLIDLGGRVLRHICSIGRPRYMNIEDDGYLVCSTVYNKIVRVEVGTRTIAFDKSVPQIKDPSGVNITSDGSIIVTDGQNKALHLVSSQGDWIKQLWSVPSDGDQDDKLWSVSMDGSVCVCVTGRGSVFVLDYS
ncbi:haemolytic enterotoxin (hbl) [Plakobranchus ocellatus]|uniref:Haemolytic enterotoxin (Hbl) n=1 Tax=Plakobranchus ocellatus TaxID=259542 RepID=A0AAV3ZEF2_9GAST|nr:haemolytic enterotoxin (hbl) [Plakobranchus ocellatus]